MSARQIGLLLALRVALAGPAAQSNARSCADVAGRVRARDLPSRRARFGARVRAVHARGVAADLPGAATGGRAANWILYRVHLTGSNDEYNYASVSYHDTWAKTEAAASWSAIVRESNPVTAKVMIDRTRELGPIVRQALFGRVDYRRAADASAVQVRRARLHEGEGRHGSTST